MSRFALAATALVIMIILARGGHHELTTPALSPVSSVKAGSHSYLDTRLRYAQYADRHPYEDAQEMARYETLLWQAGIAVDEKCSGCLRPTLQELEDLSGSLHALKRVGGLDNLAQFRTALGVSSGRAVVLQIHHTMPPKCGAPNTPGCVHHTTILLNRSVMDHSRANNPHWRQGIMSVIVHEFSHAWDHLRENALSNGLRDVTRDADGRELESPVGEYGKTSVEEDWATAVSAVVFHDSEIGAAYPYFVENGVRDRYVRTLLSGLPKAQDREPLLAD